MVDIPGVINVGDSVEDVAALNGSLGSATDFAILGHIYKNCAGQTIAIDPVAVETPPNAGWNFYEYDATGTLTVLTAPSSNDDTLTLVAVFVVGGVITSFEVLPCGSDVTCSTTVTPVGEDINADIKSLLGKKYFNAPFTFAAASSAQYNLGQPNDNITFNDGIWPGTGAPAGAAFIPGGADTDYYNGTTRINAFNGFPLDTTANGDATVRVTPGNTATVEMRTISEYALCEYEASAALIEYSFARTGLTGSDGDISITFNIRKETAGVLTTIATTTVNHTSVPSTPVQNGGQLVTFPAEVFGIQDRLVTEIILTGTDTGTSSFTAFFVYQPSARIVLT